MRKLLSILMIITLIITLTACGGDEETGNDVKYVVNLGITSFPTNTNPFTQTMQADHNALRMYENLVVKDAKTLEFRGELAESWSTSDDGLEWTIKLREGIKWQDGEKFNADDVIYSYGIILDNIEDENATFSRKSELKNVEKIEKTGDYEVKFTTKVPVANFLVETLGVIYIVPEHIWGSMSVAEVLEFTNTTPIGTSPWKLVNEFNPQDTDFEYEVYEDYWGTMPKIDGMLYILFENKDTMFQAFKAGTIDMFSPSATQVEALENENDVKVVKNLQPKLTELGINSSTDPKSTGNPILLNTKVRRAIDHALNKQELVDKVLKGVGYAGSTLVPKAAGKWHLDIEHDYNPQKAIELLEAEGFTEFETVEISGREVKVRKNADGEKLLFRLALLTDGYAWHYRDSSLFMVKWLEEVGIGLTIEPMDGKTLGAMMDLDSDTFCDFDMYIWGWTPGYDPGFILTVLHTDQIGGRQEVMYSNPEYDKLVDLQITQVVESERLETVHKAQQIIYDDAPYIPLYYQGYYDAYRTDKFEGFVQFAGEGTIFNSDCYKSIRPISK